MQVLTLLSVYGCLPACLPRHRQARGTGLSPSPPAHWGWVSVPRLPGGGISSPCARSPASAFPTAALLLPVTYSLMLLPLLPHRLPCGYCSGPREDLFPKLRTRGPLFAA